MRTQSTAASEQSRAAVALMCELETELRAAQAGQMKAEEALARHEKQLEETAGRLSKAEEELGQACLQARCSKMLLS